MHGKQVMKNKYHYFMAYAPVPAFSFLPWVPALTPLNVTDQVKQTLSTHTAFGHGVLSHVQNIIVD